MMQWTGTTRGKISVYLTLNSDSIETATGEENNIPTYPHLTSLHLISLNTSWDLQHKRNTHTSIPKPTNIFVYLTLNSDSNETGTGEENNIPTYPASTLPGTYLQHKRNTHASIPKATVKVRQHYYYYNWEKTF